MHKSERTMHKSAEFYARGSLWVPMGQNPAQMRMFGRRRTGRTRCRLDDCERGNTTRTARHHAHPTQQSAMRTRPAYPISLNRPQSWDQAQGLADAPLRNICAARGCGLRRVRVCERCVRGGRQHTYSRCMPTRMSAPRAGRGSSDPLQLVWSCLGLTCDNGDLTQPEMAS